MSEQLLNYTYKRKTGSLLFNAYGVEAILPPLHTELHLIPERGYALAGVMRRRRHPTGALVSNRICASRAVAEDDFYLDRVRS